MSYYEFEVMPRGQQVLEDVHRRRPTSWLAIDDTDEGWPTSVRDHVVLTHPVEGIRHEQVLELLKARLAMQFGEPFGNKPKPAGGVIE